MAKLKKNKAKARVSGAKAKRTAAKTNGSARTKAAGKPKAAAGVDFNHAMIYCRDVERSLGFYQRLLGFNKVDEFKYEGKPVYARLVAPSGQGTIALHQATPGMNLASAGVRLYLEIRELDEFCDKLKRAGVYFTQMPQMMPWGWRHAYCDDPDNHEVSLYWAGPARMEKTVMKAAKEASKVPRAQRRR